MNWGRNPTVHRKNCCGKGRVPQYSCGSFSIFSLCLYPAPWWFVRLTINKGLPSATGRHPQPSSVQFSTVAASTVIGLYSRRVGARNGVFVQNGLDGYSVPSISLHYTIQTGSIVYPPFQQLDFFRTQLLFALGRHVFFLALRGALSSEIHFPSDRRS